MAVVPEEYNREMLFRALHKKSSNWWCTIF
jgi:hypothetical protein